ncbi:MAG: SMC-Scp complex subunit ScpB [Propionibacteriaceae bacterium]
MTQPETDLPETRPSGGDITPAEVQAPLEALLLLAEDPVTEYALAAAVGAPVDVVRTALTELVAFYDETGRGFELRHVGEGWRYYTRDVHADLIAAHVIGGQQSRLSQAALETLAVIAYLQPISRSRVSAVRGVSVDGVIRTLVARELITEAGSDEITGATVFATTPYFLERMGLTSLDDLPDLAPHLPEADELEAELSALASSQPDPGRGRHNTDSEHDTPSENVKETS